MDRRLAIALSGTSAAVVLAVGLTAAGFAPAPRASVEAETPLAAVEPAEPTEAGESAKSATDEPEVVYVKPAPKPKTIVVKRPAVRLASTASKGSQKAVARKAAARTPRRVARTTARRSEHESEAREHEREQAEERRKEAAERRKEAAEHAREQERERADD